MCVDESFQMKHVDLSDNLSGNNHVLRFRPIKVDTDIYSRVDQSIYLKSMKRNCFSSNQSH